MYKKKRVIDSPPQHEPPSNETAIVYAKTYDRWCSKEQPVCCHRQKTVVRVDNHIKDNYVSCKTITVNYETNRQHKKVHTDTSDKISPTTYRTTEAAFLK